MLTEAAKRYLPAAALAIALTAAAQVPTSAVAAMSDAFSSPAVSARLISVQDGIPPGASTLSAGLDLDLGEGWKTYWRSPGEVGTPPRVDWSGSDNVASVDFLWPAPERFTAFGIENFGYRDDVVFPLLITLERPGEPVRLAAQVNLLTCSEICVPQEFGLTLSLPQGKGIDSAAVDRIARFAATVPVEGEAAAIVEKVATVDAEAAELTVELRSQTPFRAPDVFPELGAGTALGKPDIRLGGGGQVLWVRFPILTLNDSGFQEPVITVTDAGRRAITITPERIATAPSPPFSITRPVPDLDELAWIALIAFIGGLILNVMPCVLPVLSIKLSSAIKHQGRSKADISKGFLASGAGVMAFMWLLATLTFGLQRIGVTVGWGLQFQNPVFLALMFVVLAVFAANLFGAFEITLPGRLQTRLARAGGGHGYGGDFLTGVLASVMATPCSAPFLGTAIAFALTGRGTDIFIVFTSLGLGLAVPYLLVAAMPRLVAYLPKPGRWMLGLKVLLGLLLALTAVWLVWVLIGVAGLTGASAVVILTAILIVVLSVKRFPPLLRWTAVVAFAILPLAAAGIPAKQNVPIAATAKHDWTAFDRADIARRVSRGEVVFVDVTADWCLTCKANKALVIDRDPVAAALRVPGTTMMQADWTRPDETIARYLESFNRYGIPFNAIYGPAAPEGIVLAEVLSASAVIEALEQARGGKTLASSVQP